MCIPGATDETQGHVSRAVATSFPRKHVFT